MEKKASFNCFYLLKGLKSDFATCISRHTVAGKPAVLPSDGDKLFRIVDKL